MHYSCRIFAVRGSVERIRVVPMQRRRPRVPGLRLAAPLEAAPAALLLLFLGVLRLKIRGEFSPVGGGVSF